MRGNKLFLLLAGALFVVGSSQAKESDPRWMMWYDKPTNERLMGISWLKWQDISVFMGKRVMF